MITEPIKRLVARGPSPCSLLQVLKEFKPCFILPSVLQDARDCGPSHG